MAVGDLMLARSIGDQILAQGPAAPFAGVADLFASADVLTGNLECAITVRGEPAAKAYTFAAPPAAVDALALAGFDVLTLANNHSLDFGPVALQDMQARLGAAGIQTVGAGLNRIAAHAPVILTRHGLRLAFLGYVDVPVESRTRFDTRDWIATESGAGAAWAVPADIAADVSAAQAESDVVIVWLHMGYEGRAEVTEAQRAAAHAAVDAGAALVLGAHPHVLQPVERYGRGLIVYSLGNFVFDGFGLPENYSAVFSATLTRAGVSDFTWMPVIIEAGLPRRAAADEAQVIRGLLAPP
jgi:poly-gamma-glutamate synthesis protein (capsule biosynthesis protein)